MKSYEKLNWRILWYSAFIWLGSLAAVTVVIEPWSYPAMAFFIFMTTFFYFNLAKKSLLKKRISINRRDKLFSYGLLASIFWFVIVLAFTFFEIAHFYFFDFGFYFSDIRNWFPFVLILLIPVLYAIFLENSRYKRRGKNSKNNNLHFFPLSRI